MSEKENTLPQSLGAGMLSTTPRTPLANVANSQKSHSQTTTPVFLKRAQYSQVTPFSTPLSHTPKRPVSRIQPTTKSLTEAADVPLNSLIYKKVLDIISDKEQELKNIVDEKDSVISRLQQQLQLMTIPKIKVTVEDEPRKTTGPIGSPVFGSGFFNRNDFSTCNPSNESHNLSGLKEITSIQPFTFDDANFSFEDVLPLLDSVGSLELKPIDLNTPELELSLSPSGGSTIENYQPKSLDFNDGTKTDESIATATSPNPAKENVMSKDRTTVSTKDTGVGDSCVCLSDSHTSTTPTKMNSVSQNTSPVKCTSQGTSLTPHKTMSVGQNTEPSEVSSVSTSTDIVSRVEQETMVTPVKQSVMSTFTSPPGVSSTETCTTPPPQKQDMAVGTSPFCHALPRPSEIGADPSKSIREIKLQLETAAISNTLLRDELNAVEQDKLSIYKKVTDSDSKLKGYEEEKKRLQAVAEQRIQQAKMEMGRQLEDLMEQQADYLSQISNLTCLLSSRESQLEESKKAHKERVVVLNSELANLRRDLVTAYQQKKQQIEALKAEYTATDYHPHYERARREITELKSQLDVFSGLTEDLAEAKELQEETMKLISKRAEEVKTEMSTVDMHLEQRREWERQHQEWTAEMSKNLSSNTKIKSELETNKKTIEDLKKCVAEGEEIREQLQAELNAAEEREKVGFVESEGLKASLGVLQSADRESNERVKAMTSELEALKKMLTALNTSKSTLEEQLNKSTQECERYKRLSDMQRNSLFVLRPLSKKNEELEKELQNMREKHQCLVEDRGRLLKESEETKAQLENLNSKNIQLRNESSMLQSELESLDSDYQRKADLQTEEERAARTGLKNLAELVIQLRNHLTSCQANWASDDENVAEEERPVLTTEPTEPPTPLEKEGRSRKSGRKSIIYSVMKALSGEVESPTVDLNALPKPLLDVTAKHDREENVEYIPKREVTKEQKRLAIHVEDGSLCSGVRKVEEVVKGVLESVKILTEEVFNIIDTLKTQTSDSEATSQQVADLTQERDETARQLQVARATEAELRASLHGGKKVSSEDSSSKQVSELHQVITEKNLKIQALENMYQKAISHFRTTGSITLEDLGVVKENISLTMEVTELRQTSLKQEAMITRYANQRKKLQFNWQTAEEELKKLEQLVETVQQVLCIHEAEIRGSWKEARRLERLGMFVSSEDTDLLQNYNPHSICNSVPRP